jgi:hypothetical protein
MGGEPHRRVDLGYGPVTAPQGSLPIPQRLRTYR